MVYQLDNPYPPTIVFTLRFTIYTDLLSKYLITFLRLLRHVKEIIPAHYPYSVYIVSSYLPALYSLERSKDPYTRHFIYMISHAILDLRPNSIIFTYTPLRLFESPREVPEEILDIPLATTPGSVAYLKAYFLEEWRHENARWVQQGHHTMSTPWRRQLLSSPSYEIIPPLKWGWLRKQEVRYLQTIANVSNTGTTMSRFIQTASPFCPAEHQLDTVDHRLTTCMRFRALRHRYFYRHELESPDHSLTFDNAADNGQFFFDLYRPP